MTVESEKRNLPARRGFSEVEEIAHTGDVGALSAVAQARAAVEARYIMAERHPRVWQKVEQDLLIECSHPDFALDKSAIYMKPVGSGDDREMITGLGIRFGEIAIRCMTNILAEAPIVYEDEERLHRRVVVTDLESNTTYMYDTRVAKTMERRSVDKRDEYKIISSRPNSEGIMVFTLPITDDALYNKDNSAVSKALRNGALRVLPKHIQKRCYDKIVEVREASVKEAPDKAQKAVIDSFAGLGVMVSDLEDYLEHPIAQCIPKEIVNLQGLYAAIRDGEIDSWRTVMENIEEMRKLKPKPKPAGTAAAGVDAEKARIAEEEAAKKKAAEAAAKTTTAPAAGAKAATTKAAAKTAPAKTEAKPAETKEAAPAAGTPAAGEKAPPPWTQEEGSQPATEAPAASAKTAESATEATAEPQGEAAAPAPEAKPIKPLKIRGVVFHEGDPSVMKRTGEEDAWTPEQYELAKIECTRLNCGLEKTIFDWTGLDIKDINKETMEKAVTVLTNYKR